MVRDVAIRLDDRRRQEFRHFLIASLVLHLVAFAALMITPRGSRVAPPLGVQVRLVSLPSSAPSKPALAAPAPQAKPKPKPPKPAPVVLPTQPTAPKPVAKPVEKPVARPQPKPEAKPEPAAPPQEEEYVDVLDQLREELGEDAPEQAQMAQAGQPAAQAGSPDGIAVSPEVLAWTKLARIHVRRNWVVPPAFEMQSFVTTIDVDLDAAGNVRGTPEVRQRSGNPWYDENVVRSIQKASPLPAPPESGVWPFTFYSDRE